MAYYLDAIKRVNALLVDKYFYLSSPVTRGITPAAVSKLTKLIKYLPFLPFLCLLISFCYFFTNCLFSFMVNTIGCLLIFLNDYAGGFILKKVTDLWNRIIQKFTGLEEI